MSVQGSSPFLRQIAQRTLTDWVVGSVGVGAALLSAGFATYMISMGPDAPMPRNNTDFGVFAQFDRRTRFATVDKTSAPIVSADSEVAVPAPEAGKAIDFAPTGSIPPSNPDGGQSPAAKTGTLADFVLRDVFDGKALVEGRHRLSLVSPGTVLEGAGAVLSIEQRSGVWVVVTKEGVIRARGR